MIEETIQKINAAGYAVEAFQYGNGRWEVRAHGPRKADELSYGETLTEAMVAAGNKVEGSEAAQAASLLE